MDLNKVMIIGRLTQDPEARTTPQGVPVTNFSVATNRVWKDQQGNQQDSTEYHNIVAWRRLGEICAQYLSKGRQVYIEGHLQTRNWEGQDGQKRYRTEIVADNMIMLGSRGEGATTQASQEQSAPAARAAKTPAKEPEFASAQPASDEEIRIEDIPF
jgi:single-strand DNA-binding protein